MADSTAVAEATGALRRLLQAQIAAATAAISPQPPQELKSGKTVSLWLYRVGREPSLINNPPRRPTPDTELGRPLPLVLSYLITPMMAEAATAQKVLGQVLQSLNDHAVLRGGDLTPPFAAGIDELRIGFDPLSLEDLMRIWSATQQPHRLSVAYQVQAVTIDSALDPQRSAPVAVRQSETDQILSVS